MIVLRVGAMEDVSLQKPPNTPQEEDTSNSEEFMVGMHCTVVQCSALQCTTLQCTTLHCTVLHFTVLNCTSLQCSVVKFPALHYPALDFLACSAGVDSPPGE